VFASPEGAALIDEIADPGRDETLRLVANPLRFDGERLVTRLVPPALGEHDREVLDR
jgi:crotonobetainyl-CoA:carnitine CoA-transferase CaiB-like acyl-CoA transferase